ATLELAVRLAAVAARAAPRNPLTAPDLFAALDEYRVAMGISRDPAIGMLDENEIAVPAQLVSGISDDAGVDGLHCRAARCGDIDAVIMRTVGFCTVGCENMAANRPEERAGASTWRRRGATRIRAPGNLSGGWRGGDRGRHCRGARLGLRQCYRRGPRGRRTREGRPR